ncbi:3-oxoacyl-(acyl carrier protein) synthase III [Campylobacter sp. RM16704]|uniref:3-oxoacyl-(acyl carrier protein) synthase III n=1 Tax=Campylobacter sp. RM16704 TaxID=1500960 RepID=UPI00057E5A39|nr:3-oxoacyl-(acyl carrier protein) synthase III [Campylobacter sp. RM16704]AJC86764.1 3-oxoacyl-[acp] synthase III [Campylobacter sp. RM16704]
MQNKFSYAKISAMVMVIPQHKINIDDELHTRYNGDIKKLTKIKKSTGIQYRYLVDKNTSVSDLAEFGSKILFEDYGLNKNTIDAIIVATQTPDFFIPATACYLHGKLDLPQSTLAFDINQSCTGFVYGLYTAFSLLENGGCKRILLVCGDTINKNNDPEFIQKMNNKADIIGNGVSVSLLEFSPYKTESFFEIGNDGKGLSYLFIPYGAYKTPKNNEFEENGWQDNLPKEFYMNGLEIFNFATKKEPEVFNSLLKFAKFQQDNLDYIFFHQANKDIVDIIIKRLQLDSTKSPNDTIYKYGNLASASIPATICDTLNTHQNKLNKKIDIALCGFGAGLSWANAIISLDENFWCKETQIYKEMK